MQEFDLDPFVAGLLIEKASERQSLTRTAVCRNDRRRQSAVLRLRRFNLRPAQNVHRHAVHVRVFQRCVEIIRVRQKLAVHRNDDVARLHARLRSGSVLRHFIDHHQFVCAAFDDLAGTEQHHKAQHRAGQDIDHRSCGNDQKPLPRGLRRKQPRIRFLRFFLGFLLRIAFFKRFRMLFVPVVLVLAVLAEEAAGAADRQRAERELRFLALDAENLRSETDGKLRDRKAQPFSHQIMTELVCDDQDRQPQDHQNCV